MTKPIRGVLIDPFSRTVSIAVVDGSDAGLCASLYKLLGCDIVQHVALGNNEGLWCDEEGLLKPWSAQAFFQLGTYPQPFAGKSIILKTSPAGHTLSSLCTVEQIVPMVSWVDARSVRVPGTRIQTLDRDGNVVTDEAIGPDEFTYDSQP